MMVMYFKVSSKMMYFISENMFLKIRICNIKVFSMMSPKNMEKVNFFLQVLLNIKASLKMISLTGKAH